MSGTAERRNGGTADRPGVEAALAGIRNERLENDLMSAGMIRDLEIEGGRVSFTFLLSNEDRGTLVREARRAVEAVEGVTEVKINVTNPAGPARATHGPPGSEPAARPPEPEPLAALGRVHALSSG